VINTSLLIWFVYVDVGSDSQSTEMVLPGEVFPKRDYDTALAYSATVDPSPTALAERAAIVSAAQYAEASEYNTFAEARSQVLSVQPDLTPAQVRSHIYGSAFIASTSEILVIYNSNI
jgi:hypothetical protein